MISDEYSKFLPDEEVYHNFIEMELHRWEYLQEVNRLDTFFPLLTEKRLVDNDLMFSGTVDRVDREEDDEFVVCDYKTSVKIKDWMKSHYRFELTGYKLMLDNSKDPDVRNVIDKHRQF